MSEPTKNLTNAIVGVMSEVGTLTKDGHNAFSNYDFTTETMVVNTLRPLLVKHGLAFVPHNVSVTSEQQINEKMRRVAISATYLLLHSSGESMTITVPAEGMDSLDKSTNKALTAALKYGLLQTFCVGRGDDGDEGKGYDIRSDAVPRSRVEPTQSENAALRASRETVARGEVGLPRAHGTATPEDCIVPFGDFKGKHVSFVPNVDLKRLISYVEKNLLDPEKAKFAGKNKQLLDGMLTEINRRLQPDYVDPTDEEELVF